MKQKNIPEERQGEDGIGDVWTWVAIDADTKLIPAWLVGAHDIDHAIFFMKDVASRLANPVQLTTDGLKVYWEAVGLAFYNQPADYAMLVKKYGPVSAGDGRYSPPKCIGCDKKPVRGNPDPDHISTSFVERQNLTMRMRRFARLTNAFSKTFENLEHAVALHFMHSNFVARHQTLKVTPAMAAGVDRHLWSIEEIVELID